MVRTGCFLLILVAFAMPIELFSEVFAHITAEVAPNARTTEGNLEGKIQIYHASDQIIDRSSFRLAEKPLAAEFLFDAKLSEEESQRYPQYGSGYQVSIYRFFLEPEPQGLYILPSVSVNLGGVQIHSIPTTYTISEEQAAPSLRLEASVSPSGFLYPGQRARLIYRIIFNKPTELTKELLPLLEAEGFQKIGGKEVQTTDTAFSSVQEISQEVRVGKPGEYSFGPAVIQGKHFREDLSGRRIYEGALLEAVAPVVFINVNALPEVGQLLSFTGALGNLSLDVRIAGASTITLGDEINLFITLRGNAKLDVIQLPELACQPGFSGFFQLSDLPPVERMSEFSKEFSLPIRPLSTDIHQVPSIAFSYFDPESAEYVTLKSPEIAIEVREAVKGAAVRFGMQEPTREAHPAEEAQWRPYWAASPPMHLQGGKPLRSSELKRSADEFFWYAAIALTGVTALGLQWALREWWRQKKRSVEPLTSRDYFNRAVKHQEDPVVLIRELEQALLLALVEAGVASTPVDYLPESSTEGDVKRLILEMQASRFGRGEQLPPQYLLERAQELLTRVDTLISLEGG